MKVRIYYNASGRITSLLELKEDSKAPRAEIFPVADCQSFDLKLTPTQAKMPLIALHIGHIVHHEAGRPQLVPLTPRRRKPRGGA